MATIEKIGHVTEAKGGTPYLYAPGKPKQRVQLHLGSGGLQLTAEKL